MWEKEISKTAPSLPITDRVEVEVDTEVMSAMNRLMAGGMNINLDEFFRQLSQTEVDELLQRVIGCFNGRKPSGFCRVLFQLLFQFVGRLKPSQPVNKKHV